MAPRRAERGDARGEAEGGMCRSWGSRGEPDTGLREEPYRAGSRFSELPLAAPGYGAGLVPGLVPGPVPGPATAKESSVPEC